jgi:arylsulfatase A-like enzyme
MGGLVWLATLGALAAQDRPADRTVVLISIDGLPAFTLEEARAPIPTLRMMMRDGASARRMTVVNPSVTWPNHTTLATGVRPEKHGVLANGRIVRGGPGKPVRVQAGPREDVGPSVPTIYDRAHEAGLKTAQVDWIPWQTGGTIDWAFEERPKPAGAVEREMIEAGLVSEAEVREFNVRSNGPWRDLVWTRAATHILRRHKPNLLLLHLLNLDSTHHKYGPRTPAADSAIALADARIGDILAALREAGPAKRATVIIVSDHGFRTVRKNVRPHAALRRAGLLQAEGNRIVSCDACIVPEGGSALLYVTDPARREALLPKLREIFRGHEGIERVVEPPEFAAIGLPAPNEQMADLVLFAAAGYGFGSSPEGEPVVDVTPEMTIGFHGYAASDREMDGVFVAWGAGIRAGARLERVDNTDVAPTIAALLGLTMNGVTGKPLREILENP